MLVYVQIKEMEKVLISELIGASVLHQRTGSKRVGNPYPKTFQTLNLAGWDGTSLSALFFIPFLSFEHPSTPLWICSRTHYLKMCAVLPIFNASLHLWYPPVCENETSLLKQLLLLSSESKRVKNYLLSRSGRLHSTISLHSKQMSAAIIIFKI